MRWLDKLKQGFKKTASVLSFSSMDTEELEESLIMADMGVETAMAFVDSWEVLHLSSLVL